MYRFKRFTDKANTALNMAMESARDMGHTYVGTEHLLLGMLRGGGGTCRARHHGVAVYGKDIRRRRRRRIQHPHP